MKTTEAGRAKQESQWEGGRREAGIGNNNEEFRRKRPGGEEQQQREKATHENRERALGGEGSEKLDWLEQ